jgi:signal transduction histidine kinase
MYEPIAEDRGIALLIHSPHELSVHGDRDLLIEAAANLVDNAVKFTPEIDRILRETITDRVGPEFMAPPSLSIAA